MKTEQVIVGGNNVWISIDSLRIQTDNGFEEQANKFLCYTSHKPPGITFGSLLKDETGNIIIFKNKEDAKEAAINFATETF